MQKQAKLEYSFLSETEPSDSQLEGLMKEVIEDVRKRRKKADKTLKNMMRKALLISRENNK